jgi:hypothetical protein
VQNVADQLLDDVAGFYADPLGFVRYIFAWGEGALAKQTGPDEWQVEVLEAIGNSVGEGMDPAEAIRVAIASGHGIGKTALVAWVILWFISTRENPQIVVTANTQQQLSAKTWRELAKWHRLALNQEWFRWTATRFYHVEAPDTWFAAAIPWTIQSSEAFAGTHEKHVLIIYDEASGIPDMIWEVTEGAMTTPGAIWLAFGNPTRNTGRFKECFGRFAHRWITRQIDSRKAKQANVKQIEEWVKDYGEDSDFVRIRVRGVFPRAGSNQFIGQDLFDKCRKYSAVGFEHLPKVLVLDPARFGDDRAVSGCRQGRYFRVKAKWRGLDTVTLAERFIEHIEEEKPDAIIIDADGLGAGVVDQVRYRNFHLRNGKNILFEFHGGATPGDEAQYFNKRAEAWGRARDAMREGIDLEDDPELEADLTGPEYGFTAKNQIQLEKKEDMKKRGLASPDAGDTLAMSYAVNIRAPAKKVKQQTNHAAGWMGA